MSSNHTKEVRIEVQFHDLSWDEYLITDGHWSLHTCDVPMLVIRPTKEKFDRHEIPISSVRQYRVTVISSPGDSDNSYDPRFDRSIGRIIPQQQNGPDGNSGSNHNDNDHYDCSTHYGSPCGPRIKIQNSEGDGTTGTGRTGRTNRLRSR